MKEKLIDIIGYKNIYTYIDTNNDKMGLIDKYGNVILSPKYDVIYKWNKGGIAITEINSKNNESILYGLINSKGDILIDNCSGIFYNKKYPLVYIFQDNTGKYGLINIYGNIILQPTFSYIEEINSEGTTNFIMNNENGDLEYEILGRIDGLNVEYLSKKIPLV